MNFDDGSKTRKRSSLPGAKGLMVPYYLEGFQIQLFQLPHLARMIRMIEINDIDGTMTVGIVMVIEEVKEVVEVVVVVDKSISTKTKVRPVIIHLTCNCGGADINSTCLQSLVSMRNSTTYFTALTRCIYLVCQQEGSKVVGAAAACTGAGADHAKSSRHDVPTSEVGLACTQLSSSIYWEFQSQHSLPARLR